MWNALQVEIAVSWVEPHRSYPHTTRRRGRPGADGSGLRGLPPSVVQRGIYVGGRLRQYPRILGYVRQARLRCSR